MLVDPGTPNTIYVSDPDLDDEGYFYRTLKGERHGRHRIPASTALLTLFTGLIRQFCMPLSVELYTEI